MRVDVRVVSRGKERSESKGTSGLKGVFMLELEVVHDVKVCVEAEEKFGGGGIVVVKVAGRGHGTDSECWRLRIR